MGGLVGKLGVTKLGVRDASNIVAHFGSVNS